MDNLANLIILDNLDNLANLHSIKQERGNRLASVASLARLARLDTHLANLRPRFLVTIEPADDLRPDGVRLRRLLKVLSRKHGLKCVDVREMTEGTGDVTTETTGT